jgi:predicted membrane-bound spermidine synthase
MPDRLEDLESQLMAQQDTRINRDFTPIAYYFDMLFWSTHFHRGYLWVLDRANRIRFLYVLAAVLTGSFLASLIHLVRPAGPLTARRAACCSVWAMGFTMLALEILLLLGFQAVYGYVYHRLALIVAAFMAGMALGSWLSRRAQLQQGSQSSQLSRLVWLQLAAASSPFLISGLLLIFARIDTRTLALLISTFVFPLLALLSGFLGGYQFPVVSQLYFPARNNSASNPGMIYGLDIMGAWCASLFLSILFFPLYGLFASALLIAAVNAGPLLLAGILARRVR